MYYKILVDKSSSTCDYSPLEVESIIEIAYDNTSDSAVVKHNGAVEGVQELTKEEYDQLKADYAAQVVPKVESQEVTELKQIIEQLRETQNLMQTALDEVIMGGGL